jgi:transcriptional regulator with XRE-family HTH domain
VVKPLFDIREEATEAMSFGARLAEERKRLGLRQDTFAKLMGADVPKQSLYENDRRGLKADYLARLAEAEVDVMYVLTGNRPQGELLDEQATRLVAAYLRLSEPMQRAVVALAEAGSQQGAK